MKLPTLYLITALCFAASATAQCPSNKGQAEVALSYGIGDYRQALSQTDPEKTQTAISASVYGSFRYFVYNRLAFGITGGTATRKGHYTGRIDPSAIIATYDERVNTVAFEVYYIYTFRKYLEVYTLVGAGPAFTEIVTVTNATPLVPESSATTSTTGLMAQYTPIGIRLGGHIGAFAELGIGYKGIFNCGISWRFGNACWWRY